jgi:hypothetical protein
MSRALKKAMSEASERLKARTENFAVSVVKFCLPGGMQGFYTAAVRFKASHRG